MNNIVRDFDCFDANFMEFSEAKTNYSGGKSVFVKYNGDKLRFQSPTMNVPFGINENNGKDRLSIDFSASDEQFQNFLTKIETRVCDAALDNSEQWFRKKLTPTVINELFKRTMKTHEKFPPLMRMKLPTNDGQFTGEIYDINEKMLSQTAIQKRGRIQVIAELAGIYFVAKDFGLSWKILQVKVQPTDRITGFSFVDDDEDIEPI